MNKDPERVDQLENTYRDALNANIYSIKGAISSEQSNKAIAAEFDENTNPIEEIIGQCSLEDGRIVLFIKIKVGSNDLPISAISIVNPKNNTHSIVYVNEDLNFQRTNTIEATAKVNSKNNILVYFTDNYILRQVDEVTGINYVKEYNPPRVFNITKQIESLEVNNSSNTNLYGSSEFTVEKLDLFLDAGEIPEFADVRIDEGGGVTTGTYHLALAYKDADGNETNYLVTSNQVYIVSAHEDSFPTDVIMGDPQGSQTSKAIVWNVSIPAQSNYTKIQPVIIQRFGGGINQQSSEFAYKLQEQILPEYTGEPRRLEITYTGLESVAATSISEVVIDTVRYETAKTLVQLDNRLFLSNMESRGDIGFQRFANSINITPVVKEISSFDPKYYNVISLNSGYSIFDRIDNTPNGSNLYSLEADFVKYNIQKTDNTNSDFSGTTRKGYKDVKLSHKFKGFKRSEVYAFYISFVLNDGTETYAYHIPGRDSKSIQWEAGEPSAVINENDLVSAIDQELDVSQGEITALYPDAKVYQVLDTGLIDVNSSDTMGFWENQNETYPDTPDFDTYSVDSNGEAIAISDIRNTNVRHHKMPSNKQEGFSYISNPGTSAYSNPELGASLNMSNTAIQELSLTDSVNILGIKLTNIKIPEFILNQVQGYKIYYAKRDQGNKTILGQSISVGGSFFPNTTQSVGESNSNPSPYKSPERAILFSGMLPASRDNHVEVLRGRDKFAGCPLISFHDFNLLKNKHSLSVATHIDVQKAIVFRQWAGGKGNRKKVTDTVYHFVDSDWQVASLDDVKIKAYNTSVLIASGYFNPIGNTQFGGVFSGNLNSINSVFTIQPKSITYLPGDVSLKTTGGIEFHSIDRIMNFKGESKIVIGLSSGLPRLKGWHPNGVVERDQFSSWYRSNGYYRVNTGGDEIGAKRLFANIDNAGSAPLATDHPIGRPAAFLINLCSLKTDVYKSFDDQKLVWTGYYKKINNTKRDTPSEYYTGESSDAIFGGDTYISRYSFRSTGVPYGFSRLYRQSGSINGTPNDIPFTVDGDGNGFIGNIDVGEAPEWGVSSNWSQANNTIHSTLFSFLCETDDLLGFRHSADQETGITEDQGMLFDRSVASDVVFNGPDNDNTHMDNLLYMNNYSLNQDIRVAIPFPKSFNSTTEFPTRTIRSQNDEGSISDRYREFLALEFKDIPKNRGDIWNLFALGSTLYMHSERSIFVTKGKENLQLGDGSQAFIGSGDIFQQDPDELIPTLEGYGGTDAQFTGITTRYGQFFFNRRDKKAYILSEGIVEASAAGMEKWFLDNTPYEIEQYGIDLDASYNTDSPTDLFGFVASYDPKFKRILLTKREVIPTAQFINAYNAGTIIVENNQFINTAASGGTVIDFSESKFFKPSGWTVSYYPELKIWGSRHSYIPRLYSNTAEEFYSLINKGDYEDESTTIWEHSDHTKAVTFFGEESTFEFEFIDNTNKGYSKVFSSVYYSTDIVNIKDKGTLVQKHTNTGFTKYYVYNTRQISLLTDLSYIKNSRLVNDLWFINEFRDMANIDDTTNLPSETESMFIEEGIINNNYTNNTKPWFTQNRFTDTYLGVRLISEDNDNFIYLYSAGTKHRNSYR